MFPQKAILKLSLIFQVKILHVRNLSSDVSEEQLKKHFSDPLGEDGASKIAKVKKVKYNAFIEFNERDDAITVMEAVNGTVSETHFVCSFVMNHVMFCQGIMSFFLN